MAVEHESGWPGLPWDLLGDVLRRLPTLADQICLGAVCRPWRSGAKLLPPPFPWIVLHDGTLFDLSNNAAAYRARLPEDAYCYSAGDNMIFLLRHDGRCSLVNALSGDMTHLPELAAALQKNVAQDDDDTTSRGLMISQRLSKVVMSSSKHGPIIALLLDYGVVSSTCRPAGEINSCMIAVVVASIEDITFFQGKLCALCSFNERLITFELNSGRPDKPTPPDIRVHQPMQRPGIFTLFPKNKKPTPPDICVHQSMQRPGIFTLFSKNKKPMPQDLKPEYISGTAVAEMANDQHNGQPNHVTWKERYLVESNGKLLMVKLGTKYITMDNNLMKKYKTRHFEVWEADVTNHRWKKVDGGLDGRAIFVSFPCSKSMPIAADGLQGAQEDCIYSLRTMVFIPMLEAWRRLEGPLGDSGVYNMRTKTFTPLMSNLSSPLPCESGRFPTWFFPIKV